MITLFKLAFEFFLAAALFCGGVKFAVKYPNFAAKIDTLLSWAKSKV
jgi:hypothetical protein